MKIALWFTAASVALICSASALFLHFFENVVRNQALAPAVQWALASRTWLAFAPLLWVAFAIQLSLRREVTPGHCNLFHASAALAIAFILSLLLACCLLPFITIPAKLP
jgi:hypothetical protein